MSLDFSESLTIELPKLGDEYTSHKESATDTGLIVEIAAIHEGVTANYNYYSGSELEKSLDTWVNPYPRPVITNHDQWSEALGRVMAAKISKDNNLTTIMLQAAIGDKNAIEKFNDKRFLTGSVGGKAEQAICNICDTDWAQPPKEGSYLPCTHKRGQTYKGKVAMLEMRGINWKEYSMVNTPADATSGVRSTAADGADDGEEWVKAQLFSVNMNKESIMSFGESGATDILLGKKRKEATPLYHNIRGGFLSALVAESEEELNKETQVSGVEENDDDILAVTEELSEELAENEDATDDTAAETPADDAGDEGADDAADEGAADADDSSDEATDDVADEGASEGADEESNEDAPEASDEADDKTDEGDESSEDDKTEEPSEEGTASDEGDSDDADAAAELDDSQERITALEAENTALKDENGKLRAALKKGLAERVVDLKIDLGHESAEDRSSLIEEHVSRSASSLKDTMIDLRKAATKDSVEEAADLFARKSGSTGVKSDTKVTMIVTEEEDRKATPSDKLEDIVVAGLMGKRPL